MDPQEPPQQNSETSSDDEHSVLQQPSVATVRNVPLRSTDEDAATSSRPQRIDRTLELVPVPRYSLRRIKQRHTIRLVGTHTTESASEQTTAEPQKCLPYDNVVAVRDEAAPPVRCTVVENVRGFVQEMDKFDRGKLEYYMERMVGRTSSEVGQRQVMEIARVVHQLQNVPDQREVAQVEEKPEEENGVPLERKSSALLKAEQENALLTDRFNVILDLFNNFARNLQTEDPSVPSKLETQSEMSLNRLREASPKSTRHGKRAHSSDDGPANQQRNGRCSRYEEFYGKADTCGLQEQALSDPVNGTPDLAHRPTAETFPYSLDRDERIDMATTMSGIALTPSEQNLSDTEPVEVMAASPVVTQNTVSCQTSHIQLIPGPYAGESKPPEYASPPPAHTVVTIDEVVGRDKSVDRQPLVEYRPATPTPDPQLGLDNMSVGPMERTFHTIHIDASSSPTSSVMRRPPLCTRFWTVITDFCAAVCLCLQVNKECFFCVGFVFAFIVSASFLSAFFYRTLTMPLPIYHQHNIAVEQPAPIHLEFLEPNENIREHGVYFP